MVKNIKKIAIAVIVCIFSLYVIEFIFATHRNYIAVQEIWGKDLVDNSMASSLFSKQFSSPLIVNQSKNVNSDCYYIEYVQSSIDKSPSSTIMYHLRRNVGEVVENYVIGQIDELSFFNSSTTVNPITIIASREIRTVCLPPVNDFTLDIYFPSFRFNYRKFPIGDSLQICGIQPDVQRRNQNNDTCELFIQGTFKTILFKVLPEKKVIKNLKKSIHFYGEKYGTVALLKMGSGKSAFVIHYFNEIEQNRKTYLSYCDDCLEKISKIGVIRNKPDLLKQLNKEKR